MKTLALVIVVSVLSNFGFSQQGNTNLVAYNTDAISVKTIKPAPKSLNQNYLDEVVDLSMASHVITLEEQISNFDITTAKGYKGEAKPFKTVFKTTKGKVEVAYDKNGEIVSSYETYKGVKLPEEVGQSIFTKYPKWTLLDVQYFVSYNEEITKKRYEVKIGKDRLIRKIEIMPDGSIIDIR